MEIFMKHAILLAISVLAASTALAQTTGTGAGSAAGTAAGTTKSTDKKADTAMGASGGAHGAKAMDANGDGMISKKEYDSYHSAMWTKMKPNKGMVSTADMDAMMKGGPN
jgi:hypothetical protein